VIADPATAEGVIVEGAATEPAPGMTALDGDAFLPR
jgi:hypothetical protein